MLARIVRLAVILAVIATVFVLFIYAFLAALIVVPVLLLLFFLFGRKIRTGWVVGQPMDSRAMGDRPMRDQHEPAGKSAPPIIDHDPNDLPEKEQ